MNVFLLHKIVSLALTCATISSHFILYYGEKPLRYIFLTIVLVLWSMLSPVLWSGGVRADAGFDAWLKELRVEATGQGHPASHA